MKSNRVRGSRLGPLVSVIMPVLDGEPNIRKAIQSILGQSYENLELIVVCEPCKDGSVDIVESFEDSRIVVIKNSTRLGLSRSLNIGIARAQGDFIARMDCDDISVHSRLLRQLRFLESNRHISLCGSSVKIFGSRLWPYLRRVRTSPYAIRLAMLFRCEILHPTVFCRREVFLDEAARYDSDRKSVEDYELWSRLAAKVRFGNVWSVLLKYRLSKGSANSHAANLRSDFESIHGQIQRRLLVDMGVRLSDAQLAVHRMVSSEMKIEGIRQLRSCLLWLSELEQQLNAREPESVCVQVVRRELASQAARLIYKYEGTLTGFLEALPSAYIGKFEAVMLLAKKIVGSYLKRFPRPF